MAFTLEYDDADAAVLLNQLGLPEDTTDTELIQETIKDALTPAPPIAGDAAPSAVAAAAKRHGLDVIDTDTRQALERDSVELRRVRAAAAQAKVEAAVDDAIDKGKITPGRKKHWASLISADEKMADVLAAIPNETAVPMSEIGHASAESDTQLTPDGVPGWFY
jgi:hypothetical protein